MRRAFVVTVAVVSACTPPRTRKAAAVTENGKPVANIDFGKLTLLNPRIGNDVVHVRGEQCFVRIASDKPQTSWQPPKTKLVDCPPAMDDPAWDHCPGGNLYKHVDTGSCVCVRDGNPPPPNVETPCPG
jgi:hypothetical protein